jgi:type IV secretory pathway VirB6-like protein
MSMENPSYATGYSYSISTRTGYLDIYTVQDSYSNVSGSFSADTDKFLRGVSKATTVTLNTVRTRCVIDVLNSTTFGYHIDYSSSSLGDVVGGSQFNDGNGLLFSFLFFLTCLPMRLKLNLHKRKHGIFY